GFAVSNVELLHGAMGIANETELTDALRMLKRTFNVSQSAVGLQESSEEVDDLGEPIDPPAMPTIVLSSAGDIWTGDPSHEDPLDLGEAPADGAGGNLRTVTVNVGNVG